MTQIAIAKDGSILAHPFEAMGLGKAPFTFIGSCQNVYTSGGHSQAGGTCKFCGNGILNEFWVQSADGKKFPVGCDCIKKCDDTRLVCAVESEIRKLNKARKEAKDREDYNRLMPLYTQNKDKLQALPHPQAYFASKGKTAFDYYEYVFLALSISGIVKRIKSMQKEGII